ncbi:MAG: hypothetical protein ACREV5_22885 [Steroidobacter sp.]
MNREDRFGCDHCWPESADGAWQMRSRLERRTELIDESHFRVMLLACNSCAQRFLSVFFESIDWEDGEDPQAWTLIPITATEESGLVKAGPALVEALRSLGADRRSLQRDYPKGRNPASCWGQGILVRPHD